MHVYSPLQATTKGATGQMHLEIFKNIVKALVSFLFVRYNKLQSLFSLKVLAGCSPGPFNSQCSLFQMKTPPKIINIINYYRGWTHTSSASRFFLSSSSLVTLLGPAAAIASRKRSLRSAGPSPKYVTTKPLSRSNVLTWQKR